MTRLSTSFSKSMRAKEARLKKETMALLKPTDASSSSTRPERVLHPSAEKARLTMERKWILYASPEFKAMMKAQRIALMGYDFADPNTRPPTIIDLG